MLVMDVRGLAETDRAYARFWNHLHSIDSALSGVKLGLWLKNAGSVPTRSSDDGIVVELGWAVGDDKFETARRVLRLDALSEFDWSAVQAVALARFELPRWAHDLLATRMGYAATLPTQVSGWWTDATQKPGSRPSGALLPEGGELANERECLVLVDVDDWWGVLSPLGLGTYTFGAQLEAGETISFLDETGRRWAVRRVSDADSAEVLARWGAQAAERARAGLPAIRVKVSSIN
jgi:hypothetical protein